MSKHGSKDFDLVYDDIIHITKLAYLIKFEGTIVAVPKSISELSTKDKIVTIPEWFMIQEELEDYIDD